MPIKTKQQVKQERKLAAARRDQKARKADARAPVVIAGVNGKLSRGDKDRLSAAMLKAKRDGKVARTCQETIPYRQMFKDGLCHLPGSRYSRTFSYEDINYQIAQNEDKNNIFENWCDFLNYFDSSMNFQLSFIKQQANLLDYERSITIPPQGDGHDDLREEYGGIMGGQFAKGNNGLENKKYLTFAVEAENTKAAKSRLERAEADIYGNYKTLGVKAQAQDGHDRLSTLHNMLHPGGKDKLRFAWDTIYNTGLSSKDFIAPSSFHFDKQHFKIGDTWGAVSFLQILAPELNDRMIADFLDLDIPLTVTLHVRSLDQAAAIKTVKRKITDLGRMQIEEQKKAVRAGYDMDVLPPDLVTYSKEAATLLDDLQSRNERMFLVTVLVMNTADTKRQLENNVFAAAGVAQKHNCSLVRLDYQQEQGLVSSLPLGVNQIEIERGLTTSSTAIFVPFTSQELFMDGEALYYGMNPLSNNMIMADRKRLKNPNGLFLGVPGSGKSFSAKREMANVFLITQDDIIVADPENEYSPLVRMFGGQVIDLSPTSKHYINPMDISLNYSEDDNPLTLKSDFILSLCELIVGGKSGLAPVEKTIIDRAVRLVYKDYLADPEHAEMPILGDLYELLRKQPEAEAQHIATSLEIYVTGSLNVFNHRTNVDLHSRFVCYNIKSLGKQLKQLALLILQDQVWNRVTANRERNQRVLSDGSGEQLKSTWFYSDEFYILLRDEQTASYCIEIWKRFRKWGGIPSAMTQNVKDLLASPEIEAIFENSDFIYMLSQAPGDRAILAKKLGISPHQLSYVTHSGAGERVFYKGGLHKPYNTTRQPAHSRQIEAGSRGGVRICDVMGRPTAAHFLYAYRTGSGAIPAKRKPPLPPTTPEGGAGKAYHKLHRPSSVVAATAKGRIVCHILSWRPCSMAGSSRGSGAAA